MPGTTWQRTCFMNWRAFLWDNPQLTTPTYWAPTMCSPGAIYTPLTLFTDQPVCPVTGPIKEAKFSWLSSLPQAARLIMGGIPGGVGSKALPRLCLLPFSSQRCWWAPVACGCAGWCKPNRHNPGPVPVLCRKRVEASSWCRRWQEPAQKGDSSLPLWSEPDMGSSPVGAPAPSTGPTHTPHPSVLTPGQDQAPAQPLLSGPSCFSEPGPTQGKRSQWDHGPHGPTHLPNACFLTGTTLGAHIPCQAQWPGSRLTAACSRDQTPTAPGIQSRGSHSCSLRLGNFLSWKTQGELPGQMPQY